MAANRLLIGFYGDFSLHISPNVKPAVRACGGYVLYKCNCVWSGPVKGFLVGLWNQTDEFIPVFIWLVHPRTPLWPFRLNSIVHIVSLELEPGLTLCCWFSETTSESARTKPVPLVTLTGFRFPVNYPKSTSLILNLETVSYLMAYTINFTSVWSVENYLGTVTGMLVRWLYLWSVWSLYYVLSV